MHRLEAKNLKKVIKNTTIVENISLEVNSKEVVGLLGPNGAGKTTTFYMICGLIEATNGKVFLDDKDISNLPLHKRAEIGIGYLPQESSIFKELSVEENLIVATEAKKIDKEKRKKRVEELLELFNIEPIRHRKGVSLSGGERRRCEIARALVNEPKFLLLDEPFAGVDPIAVIDIQKIIQSLIQIGIGVLITDHNVRETLSVCNRAYVVRDGKLLAKGDAKDIAKNSEVKKHYLGENFKL